MSPQPIRVPGPHLLTHVGLSCRGRVLGPGRRRRKRKPLVAGLNLTPLIDVMMVMVCFLLLNFEASGDFCGCQREIDRPLACRAEELTRAPIVTVSPPTVEQPEGLVTLDGAEVSTLLALIQDDSPDWKIAKLTARLEVHKRAWELTLPDQRFAGQLILDADREVSFKALKKIVYSAGLAGYPELHLAVNLH